MLFYFSENGATNEAKILYMKLLKRIFDDCRVLSLLLYYCKLGVDEYETELKADRELWVNVLLVLVLGSELKEDREKYGQRKNITRYNFAFGCPLKFPLQVLKVSDNFISTLLTSSIKFTVTLTNAFVFSLPNCKIKAVFKKLTKIAIEPLNPSFVASLSVSFISFYKSYSILSFFSRQMLNHDVHVQQLDYLEKNQIQMPSFKAQLIQLKMIQYFLKQ